MNLNFIGKLKSELGKLRSRYPDVLSSRGEDGGRFEAEACSCVHEEFRRCSPEALSDHEFWRFMSVFQFHDLVEWRHGSPDLPAHLNNYGMGNTKRNVMYRMFMRAELSCDLTHEDPYTLARLGDKDLWESHIIGVNTGNVKTFVRALLKYLYPSERNGSSRLKTLEVRTLAKIVRRLRANVFLEVYDENQAFILLQELGTKAQADVVVPNA